MKSLKCVVLTDKMNKRTQLVHHIQSTESLNLLEACYAEGAMSQLQDEEVDIIFLDQQYILPVVEKFYSSDYNPLLVALDEEDASFSGFAHTYKTLIPLSYENFLKLIISAWTHLSRQIQSKKQKYVFIKSEYKLVKICLDDILFCEGMKDYTKIFLLGKQHPLVTLQNLKSLAARLPADQFIRIHRSYLISVNHIEEISRSEIVIGKKLIPIGNNFRDGLFKFVEANS